MTTALLRLSGQIPEIQITGEAVTLKNEALEAAALIGKVVDAATQEIAVRVQQDLTNLLSLIEKARKEAKQPVLDYGRTLDATCAKFVEDVKAEQLRIAELVGSFQKLEEAKARAAEQARQAEERRIAEDRRHAELAAIRVAEAERLKLAKEAEEVARLAVEAKSKAEKEALARQQVEIDRQKALAEAKSHEELDRINQQASDAQAALAERPKYEPARAHGQRVVEDYDVVVNDLWALARAHPACVNITARIGEIKSLLKAGVKVVGVVAKPIIKSTTTRSRQGQAIDIGEPA